VSPANMYPNPTSKPSINCCRIILVMSTAISVIDAILPNLVTIKDIVVIKNQPISLLTVPWKLIGPMEILPIYDPKTSSMEAPYDLMTSFSFTFSSIVLTEGWLSVNTSRTASLSNFSSVFSV